MDIIFNLSEPKQALKNTNCQEKHADWISLLHGVSLTISILKGNSAMFFSVRIIKKPLASFIQSMPCYRKHK